MKAEIERKFLVKSDAYKKDAFNSYKIKQGYLNKDKYRSVRIRITEEKAFITVKGVSTQDGLSRLEWEKEINISDAKQLLKLVDGQIIFKTRYEVKIGNHCYEVDEFHEKHKNLVIAEIELSHKDEAFSKPDWLGKEVTGNKNYYNSKL